MKKSKERAAEEVEAVLEASESESAEKEAAASTEETETSSSAAETAEGDNAQTVAQMIVEELRAVISAELSRQLEQRAADLEAERRSGMREPSVSEDEFLRLLAARLAARSSGRKRGSGILPASPKRTPKSIDDASAEARKYFRID